MIEISLQKILKSSTGEMKLDLKMQIECLGTYARSTDFTEDEKFQMLHRLWDAARTQPEEEAADPEAESPKRESA